MKLELKHLAPYLPYKLYCLTPKHRFKYGTQESLLVTGLSVNLDELIVEFLRDDELEFSNTMKWVKPILRPLHDLTKEIEVNGERFIPIIRMVAECHGWMDYYKEGLGKFGENIKSRPSKKIYNVGYGNMNIHWIVDLTYIPSIRFDYSQKLFEWHFDVFSLIPSGIAIDINTINIKK